MGTAKWIAGLLGWVAFGPIGALLGVIAGSVIEGAVEAAHQISGGAALRLSRNSVESILYQS